MCHNVYKTSETRVTHMLIGYARTSTGEQVSGLADQETALRAAGAEKLFSGHISSVDAKRDALAAALSHLRDGDVFVVTKPDRLARSTTELLAIEADLSKRGIGLVILSMGGQVLDTRSATSKLMLTILAGVAQWEREIMLERQRAGIAAAKAAGKYKGRAPTARRQATAVLRLTAEGAGPSAIARELGISRASVYRVLGSAV